MNQSKSAWANQMLSSNAVILDTETTGGAKTDQVIQLSIIDMQGRALFDSLLRPTCEIHPMAAQVHGITKSRLRGAPTLPDMATEVKQAMTGRTIIAYNVSFDRRLILQTFATFSLDATWLEESDWQCAMRAYAEHLGVKNAPKLDGGDHSALGDCLATLKLIRSMAGFEDKKKEEVEQPKVMTGHEIIALLAPPIEVIRHLEAVYEINRKNGKPVPESCVDWLTLWQQIRSADKTPIDGASWNEVEQVIRERQIA